MSKLAYRKTYIFVWLLVMSSVLGAQTSVMQLLPQQGFVLAQRYRFTTPYGFVLVNSSAHPIVITLENNDHLILSRFLIPPSSASKLEGVMAKIALDKSSILTIVTQNKTSQSYRFPLGKTLYLVLDKRGQLRPQIGQMFGLKPESKAGFVLTDNLQPGDIQLVSSAQQ